MQQLLNYAEVDELRPTTALNAFSRQFWYLTGELIHLCLFSNKLTTTQKEEIATKCVNLQRKFSDFSIPSNLEKPFFFRKSQRVLKK